MAKAGNPQVSDQVVAEALKIARATQKPGQTKEQTQLIAKGIEKGIAEYKKQHKAKVRAADKARKQAQRVRREETPVVEAEPVAAPEAVKPPKLPWVLLALSWVGFAVYVWLA